MPTFLKHPITKIAGAALALLFGLFIFFAIVNLMASSTGLQGSTSYNISDSYATEEVSMGRAMMAPSGGGFAADIAESMPSMPVPPIAGPSGYVPNLEAFETSSYNLSGRLRDFDSACDELAGLKTDDRYHFKYLTSNLNSCGATFYTEEMFVAEALGRLEQFKGVTVSRSTESVTRHREQIESRSSIIRQQLASVEATLTEAEVAYDEIAAFARAEREVEAYSNAIDTKLRQINNLTAQKINLTSQLDSIAQQAADLEERIGVVELRVNLTRSYALNPDKTTRAWERAWESLSDTWTMFGIGVTAYFGIFLLYVVQYSLYLLVLIVVARVGWKVVRKIWTL